VRVIVSSTRCAMKRAAGPSILVAVVLLAIGVTAEAQQPGKVPQIGFLTGNFPSAIAERTEGLPGGSTRSWVC